MDKTRQQKWIFTLFYLVLAVGLLVSLQQFSPFPRPHAISYSDLLDELRRGNVAEVWIGESEIRARPDLGLEKRNRAMSPAVKERVAYHEVGHALVALSLPRADLVHKVTIIPRSIGALGVTLQLPTDDRYLYTRPELEDRLAVLLGGRAAEELIYGESSTGVHDDLQQATEIARQMVMRFGMSTRLGPRTFGRSLDGRYLRALLPSGEERDFSEETAQLIDDEVSRLVAEAYDRARSLLVRRESALVRIAQELIVRETLDRADLLRLLEETDEAEVRRADQATSLAAE